MKALTAACAAALVAGCATEPPAERAAPPSPAYEEGWRDGCATGLYVRNVRFTGAPLAGDRFAHDAGRFRTNKDYAVGWGDGIRSCDTGRPGHDRPDRR